MTGMGGDIEKMSTKWRKILLQKVKHLTQYRIKFKTWLKPKDLNNKSNDKKEIKKKIRKKNNNNNKLPLYLKRKVLISGPSLITPRPKYDQ